MSAENNYEELLEEVCEKLDNIDSVKGIDVLDIKNSVESIENLITDTQAKLNFQDIKEKLEKIAFQVDSCNDALLKDLYNDLNTLKENTGSVSKHLESLQNVQNLALTSAEFEDYQKQQLDLALKTNENIFNELRTLNEKSKGTANPENIQNIEMQLATLHKSLTEYVEQIVSKVELVPGVEEIGSVVSDLNSVQHKSIKQTHLLIKEVETKLDNFKNDFDNKDFSQQLAKISEIYDSLNMINAWIEKVGYINQSIENVYARLGESIDFDDVSEKVDIIYENITALNNWTMKIDKVDESMLDIQSKLSSLSDFMPETQNITNTINSIKDKFEASLAEKFDFDDMGNKMDIVYENLSAINSWANKVDNVSLKVEDLSNKTETNVNKIDNISQKFENMTDEILNVSSKIQYVSEDIQNMSGKVQNVSENIHSVSENIQNVSGKVQNVSEKIQNLTDKVSDITSSLEEESITSKIDVVYENISLLNEWVNKIDGLTQKSEELDSKYIDANENLNVRIDILNETLANAMKIINDVPNIKDKLNDLSGELHTITSTTKDDAESYIYTLLDIESDFLKLHKFLDDKANITSNDINALKERFAELNDDISSISIRTNKLILSSDDANKEFKETLETFKNSIQELDDKRKAFNPELKFKLLDEKVTEIAALLQDTTNASKNLNNAFLYLADWVDATGSVLNTMQSDIVAVKDDNSNKLELKILSGDIETLLKKTEDLESAFDKYKKKDLPVLNEAVSYIINKTDELDEKLNKDNSEDFDKIHKDINIVKDNITSLDNKIDEINKEVKSSIKDEISIINEEIDNVKNGMTVLGEGMDNVLTDFTTFTSKMETFKTDISEYNNEFSTVKEQISKLEKQLDSVEESFDNFKTDDISELKSSLTGIMVQLNTALTPDIDSLNARIDKFVEENQAHKTKVEEMLEEKLSQQEQKISSLENKFETLTSKIDKLADTVTEESKNYEVKDILNYLVTQLAATNDGITTNQQTAHKVLNEVAEKVASFDNNINKIVSYIEED
ncbi:hypothetical protein IJ182_07695 [bacterium]|nr:hypothetical protein [bacterium]